MRNLQLVSTPSPKQNKQSYDTQRLRVQRAYADICLKEHDTDRTQISEFAESYSSFPTTAEQVYEDALSKFPQNVMCRAKDKLGITSTISNVFRLRADLRSSGTLKKGSTYHVITPARASNPVLVQAPTVTVAPPSLEQRVEKMESRLESLHELVSSALSR